MLSFSIENGNLIQYSIVYEKFLRQNSIRCNERKIIFYYFKESSINLESRHWTFRPLGLISQSRGSIMPHCGNLIQYSIIYEKFLRQNYNIIKDVTREEKTKSKFLYIRDVPSTKEKKKNDKIHLYSFTRHPTRRYKTRVFNVCVYAVNESVCP